MQIDKRASFRFQMMHCTANIVARLSIKYTGLHLEGYAPSITHNAQGLAEVGGLS